MKLSTRGRYAVQALVDLVHRHSSDPVSIFDIAQRQNLSQNYLEQLFSKLRKQNIVRSTRGQTGGYLLNKCASKISISEIIDAVDEPIKSTSCILGSGLGCRGQATKCQTHNLWAGMDNVIRRYLSSISLEDVVKKRIMDDGTLLKNTPLSSVASTIR